MNWDDLWNRVHSIRSDAPDLPIINFTPDAIIAVFMSEQRMGGHMINITRISLGWTGYRIRIQETHPGEDCIVPTVITEPYYVVRVKDFNEGTPVRFSTTVIVQNCTN